MVPKTVIQDLLEAKEVKIFCEKNSSAKKGKKTNEQLISIIAINPRINNYDSIPTVLSLTLELIIMIAFILSFMIL